MEEYLHKELTSKIIQAFYKVYNTLGYGFLEKLYENAMRVELNKMGVSNEQQKNIKVYYESEMVGDYFADLLIEELVIVELKAAENICEEHEAQLLNYLKATDIKVGLLLNFGKIPEVRRKIFMNQNKKLNADLRWTAKKRYLRSIRWLHWDLNAF
jgi:GxxExxY protein